ncbi:hypothetical protein [Alishewanella phage vB_AspM_Slickus01]|nr:hypothetical protein [Alishewanella phage vB_AspM_Slickus01]
MKIDNLYESLLEEGVSPVLFHATLAENALRILSTDTFRMSRITNDRDKFLNMGKKFFMSTARTRITKLREWKEKSNDHVALFVLNGVKLGNNFKGSAVDFFGAINGVGGGSSVNSEQEDRIVSDKSAIQNFSKYVIRLDLFSKKGKKPSKQDIALIKLRGIPVYFYNDYQSFTVGNTKNAINLLDVDLDKYIGE